MRNSKNCFKCSVHKPLHEFYKHKGMADGHLNKCKECNKKDVRENRDKNLDYYQEYDKGRANIPKRVIARKEYSVTDAGKKAHREANARWTESNLIKRAASHMVNNAIRNEKLHKSYICESCGNGDVRIHGHHDDYAFPLSVRWLCSKCHCAWHEINGSAKNG